MTGPKLYTLMIVLVLLALWQGACRLWQVPDFILPTPSRILWQAVAQTPLLLPHAGVTALEIILGIMMALALAIPLAVVMFACPSLEKAIAPF